MAIQAADQAAVVGAGDVPTYPSRALAVASSIPEARTYILTAGYAAVGDGGGALYKRLGAAPPSAKAWHFQSADGAWWELAESEPNTLQFGAVPYPTDSYVAFRNHVEYCISKDIMRVKLPAGTFYLTAGIEIALSSTDIGNPGLTIEGAGVGATSLKFGPGEFRGIQIAGSAPFSLGVTLRGFKVYKDAADRLGVGIRLANLAYAFVEDIWCYYWREGLELTDILSSCFTRVQSAGNVGGLSARRVSASRPNALSFLSCVFGGAEYGVSLTEPSTVAFYGGSFEGSGSDWPTSTTPTNQKAALRVINAGSEGAAGVTISGVYFEGNRGLADIYIENGVNTCSYEINGCTFNRVGVDHITQHNIFVVGTTLLQSVHVAGCGFKGFGAYAPSATRPYIAINSADANIKVTEHGNMYAADVERPVLPGGSMGEQASAAGVLLSGHNIKTITRTGAGIYEIAFRRPMRNIGYCPISSIAASGAAVVDIMGVTTTGFTLLTRNTAGTPADYGRVFVTVFGELS
jgi:hypothetical protein